MAQPRGDLQLALGYWIVSHRDQLRKWWVLLLFGFIAISLSWCVLFFIVFSGQQRQTENWLVETAAVSFQPHPETIPKPIEVKDVVAISRGPDRVDLVGQFVNANADWGAKRIDAHFEYGGQALDSQTIFVNPNSQRPVIRLNVPIRGDRQVRLVIDRTEWARTSSAALPASSFGIEKVEIRPTTVVSGGRSFFTINLQAELVNRSVYNFVQVAVPILLRNTTSVVAVEELRLDRWPTLTTKTLNHTWSYPISSATVAEILPQVSQFDPDNLYR